MSTQKMLTKSLKYRLLICSMVFVWYFPKFVNASDIYLFVYESKAFFTRFLLGV